MKAIVFVTLTFAVSWLFVGLYLAFGGSWTMPGAMIVSVVYMFVPMVSAVVVQRGLYKARLKEPLRIHFRLNRWFLVAWLLPAAISASNRASRVASEVEGVLMEAMKKLLED